MNIRQLVVSFQESERRLIQAVITTYPVGTWVRVAGTGIVGKVFAYGDGQADMISLVLENGQPRMLQADWVERCSKPAWALTKEEGVKS